MLVGGGWRGVKGVFQREEGIRFVGRSDAEREVY